MHERSSISYGNLSQFNYIYNSFLFSRKSCICKKCIKYTWSRHMYYTTQHITWDFQLSDITDLITNLFFNVILAGTLRKPF